jgi:hypothetical protein
MHALTDICFERARILVTPSQQMAAQRLKKSRECLLSKRRNNRQVEESEKKLMSTGGKNFRGAAG